MNTTNLIKNINMIGQLASKHLPDILCAVGTVCSIVAVVEASKAAPDIEEALEEAEDEKGEDLTTFEKVVTVAKVLWRSIASEVAALFCFWGAFGVSRHRLLILTAAYALEKQSFADYVIAAKEVVGDSKANAINSQVAQNLLSRHPVDGLNVYNTGNGDYLCLDAWSGRYFLSNENSIRAAANTLTDKMRANDCVLVNDLYFEIKLPPTEEGNYSGWDLAEQRMQDHPYVDIQFTTGRATDGRPCLVVLYKPMPIGSWRTYDTYDNQYNYPYSSMYSV